MSTSLYLGGSYLQLHPTWHVEDSRWKASKVLEILDRNHLIVQSLVEIGCGAGEVLACLQRSLPSGCKLRGFEISPDAYRMCVPRANESLTFELQTAPTLVTDRVDVVMALDVLEHTEDYFSFLRSMREQGEYCLLHVPLDLSVQSLLWGLPQRVRRSAGHLHYFTAPILFSAVQECGLEVIDVMYTRPGIERRSSSVAGRIARYPRLLLSHFSESWAALTVGGFSIMVLAKRV